MASPSLGNVTFPQFRSDLNAIIADLDTLNAGSTAPTDFAAYTRWLDTSATPPVLKIRNAANTAWVDFYSVASQESIQDFVAAMLTGGTHDGISFTYDDANGEIDATVDGGGFTAGTPQDLTGLSTLEVTGIPSGTTLLKINIQGTLTTPQFGSFFPRLRLGAGSLLTTGYKGFSSVDNTSSTTVLPLWDTIFTSSSLDFNVAASLQKNNGNNWILHSATFLNNAGGFSVGLAPLSGALQRFEFYSGNANYTFSSGYLQFYYQ